ncbi:MAG TPA: hypothetical protein VFN22_09485 [Gemmatimonadales bacterium]|nr:hypothetical protein [Gemmatimonadales bacterium]
MAIREAELLRDITPTEAVLLFGDRVVEALPAPGILWEEVPMSGKGVDGLELVDAAMETLVAALIEAGAVPRIEETRKFIFFTTIRLHLHIPDAMRSWPTGSPEARVVAWIVRQPGQSAPVEDALIALFMPTRHHNVWRMAYQALHDGLVERGYIERRTITVLKVVQKQQFGLHPEYRAPLTGAASAFERDHLHVRTRLRPETRVAAFRSWRAAFSEQNITTGD